MKSVTKTRRARAIVIVLLASAIGLGTCLVFGQDASLASLRTVIAREYPEVPWITPDELARALRGPTAGHPRLLDARTDAEFAVSHLDGATRIDPDRPNVPALGANRTRPVVVYCAVGYRSAVVTRALLRAGFTNAKNLEGGIFAWANHGRPVHRGGRVVRDVHPFDDTWGRMLRAELRTRTPR